MMKKVFGSLALVVGFGFALVFLYYIWFYDGDSRPPEPSPSAKPEIVPRTAPEFAPKPAPPEPQAAAPSEPAPPPAAPPAPPEVTPAPEAPPAKAPVAKVPPAEVAPSEEEAITTQEPEEGYGLLAGRFRSYRAAQKLLEKIKKRELPGFIRKKGKYYEVWVGPFPSSQEAKKHQKSIRGSLKISAKMRKFAIPVPK